MERHRTEFNKAYIPNFAGVLMKKYYYIAIVAVLVIAIVGGYFALYSHKNFNAGNSQASAAFDNSSGPIQTIVIQASRWQYTPDTITVKEGTRVHLIINNTDFGHGIAIPQLGVFGMDSADFVAGQPGTYQFRCPTYCGAGHRDMVGSLVITA